MLIAVLGMTLVPVSKAINSNQMERAVRVSSFCIVIYICNDFSLIF